MRCYVFLSGESWLYCLTCTKVPGFWMVEHQLANFLIASQRRFKLRKLAYFHKYDWFCYLTMHLYNNFGTKGDQVTKPIIHTVGCKKS